MRDWLRRPARPSSRAAAAARRPGRRLLLCHRAARSACRRRGMRRSAARPATQCSATCSARGCCPGAPTATHEDYRLHAFDEAPADASGRRRRFWLFVIPDGVGPGRACGRMAFTSDTRPSRSPGLTLTAAGWCRPPRPAAPPATRRPAAWRGRATCSARYGTRTTVSPTRTVDSFRRIYVCAYRIREGARASVENSTV